jgi:UDP-glucose 4-epimerase
LRTDQVNTIHNIGSGIGSSVNDIYRMLKEISNFDKPAFYAPAKAGETRRIYLDITRAGSTLDWKPTFSLQEGLKTTVDHFRQTELVQRDISSPSAD